MWRAGCNASNPAIRIYKTEEIETWYMPLIQQLGWQAAVESGWPTPNGCFYQAPGLSCAESVQRLPTARTANSSVHCIEAQQLRLSVGDSEAAGKEEKERAARVTRAGKHDCARMQRHYTPKLAQLVSEYASSDLEQYGYRRWSGDIRDGWF